MTNPKAKRLFVLAGYRASGKTTALQIAGKNENFTIFRPESMPDFRLVQKANPQLEKSSGFHTYNDFSDLTGLTGRYLGVHYDFTMPLQNYAQHLFKTRATKLDLALHTPGTWTSILKEILDDGSLARCIANQFSHFERLSSAFEHTEISIVKTSWETNRGDWITRMERITGSTLEEQRRFQKHSFNVALFDDDLKLGARLYAHIHDQWERLLKASGQNYLWISRAGSHYDVRPTKTK